MASPRPPLEVERRAVAAVGEYTTARVRDLLMNPDRDLAQDAFLAGLLDAVHNIPVWLARSEDPYQELVRFLGYMPHDVAKWVGARLAFELEWHQTMYRPPGPSGPSGPRTRR